ncbi:hypothetical protein [Corynebacterium endometrii]|nr:hypothetical protein [Corynebacterium endometrii]
MLPSLRTANAINHAEIPDAIDKPHQGGVVGRFIAVYEGNE